MDYACSNILFVLDVVSVRTKTYVSRLLAVQIVSTGLADVEIRFWVALDAIVVRPLHIFWTVETFWVIFMSPSAEIEGLASTFNVIFAWPQQLASFSPIGVSPWVMLVLEQRVISDLSWRWINSFGVSFGSQLFFPRFVLPMRLQLNRFGGISIEGGRRVHRQLPKHPID